RIALAGQRVGPEADLEDRLAGRECRLAGPGLDPDPDPDPAGPRVLFGRPAVDLAASCSVDPKSLGRRADRPRPITPFPRQSPRLEPIGRTTPADCGC